MFLGEPTVTQLVKAIYETRQFITVFTTAHQWTLFWAIWIQPTPPNRISLRSILILSSQLHLGLLSGLLPFSDKKFYAFLIMQFSSPSSYFLSHRSKYSSQTPLIHVLSTGEETMFLGKRPQPVPSSAEVWECVAPYLCGPLLSPPSDKSQQIILACSFSTIHESWRNPCETKVGHQLSTLKGNGWAWSKQEGLGPHSTRTDYGSRTCNGFLIRSWYTVLFLICCNLHKPESGSCR